VNRSTHVLVTAAAGDLGQAIIKALRLADSPLVIHGCDVARSSYAAAFVNYYHCVPLARDPSYVESLDKLTSTLGIHAVVPGSEAEILSLGGSPLPSGTPVVSQPRDSLSVFSDKLSAMEALRGRVELADFADGGDPAAVETLVSAHGYPVVVKPRLSSGSRGVWIVSSREELVAAIARTDMPIVQEYLDDTGGEFSVGVFRCREFEGAIAFRRKLARTAGLSWEAEVVDDESVCRYAMRVAQARDITGSVNVQLRSTMVGPRLLEVNARFSSLAAARALAGFRDVEWAVALALGESILPGYHPLRFLRFRRFYHEVVDLGSGFGSVPEWQPRSVPHPGSRNSD